MANNLPKDKKATVIAALCEGSSIRSIERMTNVHRDTIMRLGVRVGSECEKIHPALLLNRLVTYVPADLTLTGGTINLSDVCGNPRLNL